MPRMITRFDWSKYFLANFRLLLSGWLAGYYTKLQQRTRIRRRSRAGTSSWITLHALLFNINCDAKVFFFSFSSGSSWCQIHPWAGQVETRSNAVLMTTFERAADWIMPVYIMSNCYLNLTFIHCVCCTLMTSTFFLTFRWLSAPLQENAGNYLCRISLDFNCVVSENGMAI